jgi:predicted hotdog family 3-hydroxylacyl-ACP dehydratase
VTKITGMRRRGRVGLEGTAHGVAVHAGHHHVQQDELGLLLTRHCSARTVVANSRR